MNDEDEDSTDKFLNTVSKGFYIIIVLPVVLILLGPFWLIGKLYEFIERSRATRHAMN